MERTYPKVPKGIKSEPQKVTLLTAARLMEDDGEEPFVLFPTDDTKKTYERQALRKFLTDCMFFVERKKMP